MNINFGMIAANSLWLVPVVILAVVFVMAVIKGYKTHIKPRKAREYMLCSIDVDCPPNFVCMDGYCVPESEARDMASFAA